jgi:hypothetical protein
LASSDEPETRRNEAALTCVHDHFFSYKREATLTNPMGGSDKINFGNPRRNRRNRAGRESPANATANSAAADTTTESGGNDGNDGL